MPGPNKFFDDMSKLMTNAMGVAQGAKTEAETAMKGFVDRWLADREFRDPRRIGRGARHGAEGSRRKRSAEGADRGSEAKKKA